MHRVTADPLSHYRLFWLTTSVHFGFILIGQIVLLYYRDAGLPCLIQNTANRGLVHLTLSGLCTTDG